MFTKLLFFSGMLYLTSTFGPGNSPSKEELRLIKHPPCTACKVFVDSFKNGIEQTKNGQFEGGDSAWEAEKLGRYATSELRLIEIVEKICLDVVEGQHQCYSFYEMHDELLDEWWFKQQKEEPNLFKYICIDNAKVCCPEFHFGANCKACPGFPDNVCNFNGKCRGAGTRKGNGSCVCNLGYKGIMCDSCDEGYYQAYKDKTKMLCSKCHSSCSGSCSKGGHTGCDKCKMGWIKDKERGCLDVNECATSENPCQKNEFCVNNEGSYGCLSCDKSCAGCTGDGPDMCSECADGYVRNDNLCIDKRDGNRKTHVTITRLLTYLGLLIATCIICKKSTALAAAVGLAVASYITVSEYMLNK